MKKHGKGFVAGVLTTLLIMSFGVTAFAAYQKQAALSYDNIKVTVNGSAVTPTDAAGKAIEPFIIDGTTYLPVRGVASALSMDVAWDGNTKTVALSSKQLTLTDATLTTGNYVVGRDIAAGLYNAKAAANSGNFVVRDQAKHGKLNEVFGVGDPKYYTAEYKNLKLENGDTIEISGGLSVLFAPVK